MLRKQSLVWGGAIALTALVTILAVAKAPNKGDLMPQPSNPTSVISQLPSTKSFSTQVHTGASATATLTPACTPSWNVISSPNIGQGNNILQGITAITSDDIWAVGYYLTINSVKQTLTEHWDGSSWHIIPSPNNGSGHNYLQSVSALSSNDVWAAGSSINGSAVQQTLILHWNGSQWVLISSPNVGASHNVLNSITSEPPA